MGYKPAKDRLPQDAAAEQPWMARFCESFAGLYPVYARRPTLILCLRLKFLLSRVQV